MPTRREWQTAGRISSFPLPVVCRYRQPQRKLHDRSYDNDGNITWELVNERVNSDLANNLGNLVSRTAAMSGKYFGGVLHDAGESEPLDEQLKSAAVSLYKKVAAKMDEFKVSDALDEIFSLLRRCNKYIDETAPWVLAKDESNQARLATVLYNLSECIVIAASLLSPFLPETAEKIAKIFGCSLLFVFFVLSAVVLLPPLFYSYIEYNSRGNP